MSAALGVHSLTKRFGGVTASDACTFSVGEGVLAGLIGPNGSGKTTVLNMVSGHVRPDSGHVTLFDRPISGKSPTLPYRRGLGRTFQRARVFPSVTVRENMHVSVPTYGTRVLKWGVDTAVEERASQLLEEFQLLRLADVPAGELSYGQQKLLEFAMALMSRPKVLLLDEPTAGVNPVLIGTMEQQIRRLHGEGVTIVVVEHNMEFVMSLCMQIVVLNHGQVLCEGLPDEIQRSELVLDAYLGN
jgi:neutral amino acid transport system ATP-binding protein